MVLVTESEITDWAFFGVYKLVFWKVAMVDINKKKNAQSVTALRIGMGTYWITEHVYN